MEYQQKCLKSDIICAAAAYKQNVTGHLSNCDIVIHMLSYRVLVLTVTGIALARCQFSTSRMAGNF